MLSLQDMEQIKRDAAKITRRRFEDAAEDGSFTPTETPKADVVVEESETAHVMGKQESQEDESEVEKLRAQLKAKEEELKALKSDDGASESKAGPDETKTPRGRRAKQSEPVTEDGKTKSTEQDPKQAGVQHKAESGQAA